MGVLWTRILRLIFHDLRRRRLWLGCLASGVVVSLLVSWQCESRAEGIPSRSWPNPQVEYDAVLLTSVAHRRVFGADRVFWRAGLVDSDDYLGVTAPAQREWIRDRLPGWAAAPRFDAYIGNLGSAGATRTYGWPMRCTRSTSMAAVNVHFDAVAPIVYPPYVSMEERSQGSGGPLLMTGPLGVSVFSYGVRPLGLLVNSVFYGVIVRVAFFVLFEYRALMRRRRGECVRCGYSLAGLQATACPECGADRDV